MESCKGNMNSGDFFFPVCLCVFTCVCMGVLVKSQPQVSFLRYPVSLRQMFSLARSSLIQLG